MERRSANILFHQKKKIDMPDLYESLISMIMVMIVMTMMMMMMTMMMMMMTMMILFFS